MRYIGAILIVLAYTTGACAMCMPNQPNCEQMGQPVYQQQVQPPMRTCHMQCYQVGNQTQCQQVCF